MEKGSQEETVAVHRSAASVGGALEQLLLASGHGFGWQERVG